MIYDFLAICNFVAYFEYFCMSYIIFDVEEYSNQMGLVNAT